MSKTTINIDTDIDETLKKVEELIVKCEELGDKGKQLYFITVKELAEMRGCSLKTALDLFNLPDFPSEDFGKEKVVYIEALKEFYMKKRSKKDYE